MLLLVCLFLQAIPAQCAEKIFFSYSTAQRLYVDMEFSKKEVSDKVNRLTLCDKDRTLLENQTVLLDTKIVGLQADKAVFKKESDRFQALYVEADQGRVKAINDAPSRLRWFAAGVMAVLTAAVAGFVISR